MATPTPAAAAAKSSAQNVSTPQSHAHLNPFSSPVPRSVPSPAATRGQAGKSPFNSQHFMSASQNPLLNHPTITSTTSGPKFLDSSPAGLPNFDSPGTMIPSMSSMGLTDGGVAMGQSMSRMGGLPGNSAMGVRLNDEERRKRLEAVVNTLKKAPVRLSTEGMEILAQRQGMESLLDPAHGFRKDGTRDCTIAGETIAVDIKFSGNVVEGVEISIPGSSEATEKHLHTAAHILQNNLSIGSQTSPLLVSLDKFSKNLEKLAKIDKLNAAANSPNFNCFEAISGVYTSLKKLYDRERELALVLINASKSHRELRAERETMCKRSGRPQMNGHDKIGLSIDYWMDKRHSFVSKATEKHPGQHVYSIGIDCDSMTTVEHVPVRISNNWISDENAKQPEHPDDIYGPVIDWQEPAPTYLADGDHTFPDPMSLDGATTQEGRLPNIRFVAKLEPPLAVPLQVAANILAATGSQRDQEGFDGLYHSLVLGNKEVDPMALYSNEEEIRNTKQVALESKSGKTRSFQEHNNCLMPKTVVLGKMLDEIPFSHPKQIVQILPILRQWVVIGTLIRESFSKEAAPDSKPSVRRTVDVNFDVAHGRFAITFSKFDKMKAVTNGVGRVVRLAQAVQNEDAVSSAGKELPTRQITFDVLQNGDINIVGQDIIELDMPEKSSELNKSDVIMEDGNSSEKLKVFGKVLDITGDIDMFVSWIDSKY
jgi:hypothetical protein